VRNLRIVPHTLSPAQKVARVESAIQLKKILLSAKHRGWRYILTGDESWFYFTINYDHIWLPDGALTPTRPRHTINTPKRMLTIFWSPLGFPLVQLLPKGQHFNARYFCENILQEINQNRPAATAEDGRRNILLHFDNATPHTAGETLGFLKSHRMKRAPHPAFSPDLAPSDFYLFGKIKTALMGSEFASEKELLDGVLAVISAISREELEAVFEDWLSRLDQGVQ
jgi:histone-lysine N-methyltransferase SETMAR